MSIPGHSVYPARLRRFWPEGWWRLMEIRIGIIPLPLYFALIGIVIYFLGRGEFPTEINMMIAVLTLFGFTCGEIGKRMPLIRHVGGGAIFATFIPSALVYHELLPITVVTTVTNFTKSTNFLYLFIAAVVVGSILGMDRKVLVKGFLKIFVPLTLGSIAAACVGVAVGSAFGLGARHTFFFIVVPIMAGGVGEGAIPLSLGYAGILNQDQGALFAQLLPIVMLGSLSAILVSGALNFAGKRFPHLTGEGRLQPGEQGDTDILHEDRDLHVDVTHISAAAIMAITLYLLGLLSKEAFGLPAPVSMLFIAVALKLSHAVSPALQEGSYFVSRFFATAVTYPLLFAIGVSMTPWEKLIGAFTIPTLITIFATVLTLIGVGFVVGRWVNLFPIEAAIVNACHSGQGGTGDVAILTAANRMQLMPFAQIATRLGGAITVTLSLIALALINS